MTAIRRRPVNRKKRMAFCLTFLSVSLTTIGSGILYALNKTITSDLPKNTVVTTSNDSIRYQIVFSTGCNQFMDWQSYVFFYHAAQVLSKSEPPFTSLSNTQITRILSGCSPEEASERRKIHEEQIEIMTPERDIFRLHFTPEFARADEGSRPYRYFNKPLGTHHWFQNALGYYTNSAGSKNNAHDNEIFVLMDPDMIMLKPFTHDFSQRPELWSKRTSLPYWNKVAHGRPFAQHYGFGTDWFTKTDVDKISPSKTPTNHISSHYIGEHFAAGPPYMATGKDMSRIAAKWAELVVPVHQFHPRLNLGEMYAYSIAAFQLELPHQITDSFMLSDANDNAKEWERSLATTGINEKKYSTCDSIPPEDMPTVLHYCNRYWLGKWFFEKYKLPKDFFSCEAPLLRAPNMDDLQYDYAIDPKSSNRVQFDSKDSIQRHAFMLCQLIPRMNEAARFYKKHHCSNSNTPPNMQETLVFHESMEIE